MLQSSAQAVVQPSFRTQWMVPRNIRKIEPWKLVQIATILHNCGGSAGNQDLQDDLYEELERLGIKCPKSEGGVTNPGGFRTYLAQLACLGFFWLDPQDKTYKPTRAGEALLEAEEPVKLLVCQLLRMQFPSVYGLGSNVRVSPELKVKPFVFLMNLLERDDLDRKLSSDEMAVAVIYGHEHKDEDFCAQKIRKMRSQNGKLEAVVDNLQDLCTPKRWKQDEALLWKLGIEDARTIGNTFKNYMQAAGLISASSAEDKYFVLSIDSALQKDVAAWRRESIEKAPQSARDAHWQQRFGRYDRQKIQTRTSVRRSNGFADLLRARYLKEARDNPYAFSHHDFVQAEAQRWHKTEVEVEDAVRLLRPKTGSVYRDELMRASRSGGAEAQLLEKGVANIFISLGFDKSRHVGQKKAVAKRMGGFPDIWIQASGMPESGWADSKATVRYGFPVGDVTKLGDYYKDCWQEIDPDAPSRFFIYVAGGFEQNVAAVKGRLARCAEKFGRPVSAVTVGALCDLVEGSVRPDAKQIFAVFARGGYFNSADQIIAATDCPSEA